MPELSPILPDPLPFERCGSVGLSNMAVDQAPLTKLSRSSPVMAPSLSALHAASFGFVCRVRPGSVAVNDAPCTIYGRTLVPKPNRRASLHTFCHTNDHFFSSTSSDITRLLCRIKVLRILFLGAKALDRWRLLPQATPS